MGYMNICLYLLQHGSCPNTTTVRGETALHLAARANQTDIIRILLRNGATVDARARVCKVIRYFELGMYQKVLPKAAQTATRVRKFRCVFWLFFDLCVFLSVIISWLSVPDQLIVCRDSSLKGPVRGNILIT